MSPEEDGEDGLSPVTLEPEARDGAPPGYPDAAGAAQATPAAEEEEVAASVMKKDDWVLIEMPSENVKLVKLTKDSVVQMGKFGSFPVNDIVGMPYDHPYEVVGKTVEPFGRTELEEVDETGANNRTITNDGFAQKIASEEIERLKIEGLKGEVSSDDIIQQIVQHHAEFEKKTEYSKAKYIKKKKQKYSKVFRPVRPRIETLCNFYFKKSPSKIRFLRIDTLAQVLSIANVHAGGRYLVVDDVNGLVVASVLERLGGCGSVFAFHNTEQPNFEVVKYMNLLEPVVSILTTLHLGHVPKDQECVVEDVLPEGPIAKYERRAVAQKRILAAQHVLWEGGFDALLVASQFAPEGIIELLLPYLASSRPLVVYSAFREVLVSCRETLAASPDWLNPVLSESFLREYQVLPGRTHPAMNTSGTGGYVLTALRVVDNPSIVGNRPLHTKNTWGKRFRV